MKGETNKSSSLLKNLMFSMAILLLIMPGLQQKLRWVHEPDLTGAYKASPEPGLDEFSTSSWLDGSFQETFSSRLEQHIGFRNTLVRINNQVDYSLYHQAHAEGVIVGLKGELFEEDYLKEYTGLYFVGDSVWKNKAIQLKAVQDTLSKLGKTLIVVFEPGKGSFYPERMPRKYSALQKSESNYDCMRRYLLQNKVNVLDLNQYFISIKDHAKFPVFPKGGTHWSYYGAALAADTTLKYIENLRKTDLPDMEIANLKASDSIRHPDYDIGLAMNLLFRIPQPRLANPVINFSNRLTKTRPDVLIAGDSFYFNWLNNRIPANAFNTCDFWYYNKNITRSDGSEAGSATQRNFKDEILKRDIIIIMITERFHHAFAWRFDEQIYDLFFPGQIHPIDHFANQIRSFGNEFVRMYDESKKLNISLEQRINQEAGYLFYADHKKNPGKYTRKNELLMLYEMGIEGTPDWLEKVKQKAEKNGRSLKTQLRMEAEWMYNEKHKNQ